MPQREILLCYDDTSTYGLLTKREVKMAGYWPNFRVYSSWSINTQKKTRPITSHLDRTSLVNKGFIILDKTPKNDLWYCGTKREIPNYLAHSASQSQLGIWFILPAHGASSHIINIPTSCLILVGYFFNFHVPYLFFGVGMFAIYFTWF